MPLERYLCRLGLKIKHHALVVTISRLCWSNRGLLSIAQNAWMMYVSSLAALRKDGIQTIQNTGEKNL